MAVAKICGIETEYGIVVRNGDPNPIAASSLLINAYLGELNGARDPDHRPTVAWDFEDEQPGVDARAEALLHSVAPEIETHLVNAVLTNGARYYDDHAHPEYSAP
ncbi:MAG: proteasome accessory factor PafA2 family protein, partial [Actinomycetes bacterium]